MHDLISRKWIVKELLKERDKYPPMKEERYSFGVKVPNNFCMHMRGGIRKGLRLAETAPTAVVCCKDCIHSSLLGSTELAEESPWKHYRKDCRVCRCVRLIGYEPIIVDDDFFCGYGSIEEDKTSE